MDPRYIRLLIGSKVVTRPPRLSQPWGSEIGNRVLNEGICRMVLRGWQWNFKGNRAKSRKIWLKNRRIDLWSMAVLEAVFYQQEMENWFVTILKFCTLWFVTMLKFCTLSTVNVPQVYSASYWFKGSHSATKAVSGLSIGVVPLTSRRR